MMRALLGVFLVRMAPCLLETGFWLPRDARSQQSSWCHAGQAFSSTHACVADGPLTEEFFVFQLGQRHSSASFLPEWCLACQNQAVGCQEVQNLSRALGAVESKRGLGRQFLHKMSLMTIFFQKSCPCPTLLLDRVAGNIQESRFTCSLKLHDQTLASCGDPWSPWCIFSAKLNLMIFFTLSWLPHFSPLQGSTRQKFLSLCTQHLHSHCPKTDPSLPSSSLESAKPP